MPTVAKTYNKDRVRAFVAGMRVLTIIIVVVLCLVAAQVVVVVVYIAVKRYYYDHVRQKMRFQRLEKLAMFIPAASAKIHQVRKHVKDSAQRQVRKLEHRTRSESFSNNARIRDRETDERQQTHGLSLTQPVR